MGVCKVVQQLRSRKGTFQLMEVEEGFEKGSAFIEPGCPLSP